MGSDNSKKYKMKYQENPDIDNKNINRDSPEKNDPKSQKIITQKMVTVIIPLKSGFWEKSYNIETSLSQIASDFLQENNMNNIPKDRLIEWSFKNNPLNMDSSPLKSLINEDTNTIHIAQEIKTIPGKEKVEINEQIDIVGKPFYMPFLIFTFEAKKKLIKTRAYNQEQIKQIQLDKFGIDSAYCNGNNSLYISGGLDQATNEEIDLFWEIDLSENLFCPPVQMTTPKKNHSMIYSEKKVYIIGGDDLKTMIFDVATRKISELGNLNYKRYEPSLIRHGNYLFCFDTSRKYLDNLEKNVFNFEKIDLSFNSGKWELVSPQISPNLTNSVFCQKFFGVVEDFRENIIFVGGIYDYDFKENDEKDKRMNLQYNINKNMMEESDLQFEEISFSEKTFLPLDNKIYCLLPNFNKHSPKLVYFYKDKNNVYVDEFHHNSKQKKRIINRTIQVSPFYGFNLNMPTFKNGIIVDDKGYQETIKDPNLNYFNKNNNNNNIDNINNDDNDNDNYKINTPPVKENKINEVKMKDIVIDIPDNSNINNSKNQEILKAAKNIKKNNDNDNDNIQKNNSNSGNSIMSSQRPLLSNKPEEKEKEKEKKIGKFAEIKTNYYIDKSIPLSKFHSSNYIPLNNRDNAISYKDIKNIKRMKMNIIPAKKYNEKSLRRQRSEIYKEEINEFKV